MLSSSAHPPSFRRRHVYGSSFRQKSCKRIILVAVADPFRADPDGSFRPCPLATVAEAGSRSAGVVDRLDAHVRPITLSLWNAARPDPTSALPRGQRSTGSALRCSSLNRNEGNRWLRDPPKRVPRLGPKKYHIGSSGEGSCPGFGPKFLVGHEWATAFWRFEKWRFSGVSGGGCESGQGTTKRRFVCGPSAGGCFAMASRRYEPSEIQPKSFAGR